MAATATLSSKYQISVPVVWAKAVAQAVSETGLDVFPEECPWTNDQIMGVDFFPDL